MVKDFRVGQAVVIAGDGNYTVHSILKRTDATVTNVGRKYVHVEPVGGGYSSKYRDCDDASLGYLIEQTEIGSPRLLFPSPQAADSYQEHEELKSWLVKAAGWGSIHRYTLEQLRAVKQILEGDSNV